MDELDRLVRALEAERYRPVPPRPRRRVRPPSLARLATPEQLAAIEAEVAADDGRRNAGPAAGRREDYLFLISQGESEEHAAERVGVSVETARTYDTAS